METNKLGRVLEYNSVTARARTVQDGLYLANGLSLSQDETYLIVAEMSVCKMQKYVSLKSTTYYRTMPGILRLLQVVRFKYMGACSIPLGLLYLFSCSFWENFIK